MFATLRRLAIFKACASNNLLLRYTCYSTSTVNYLLWPTYTHTRIHFSITTSRNTRESYAQHSKFLLQERRTFFSNNNNNNNTSKLDSQNKDISILQAWEEEVKKGSIVYDSFQHSLITGKNNSNNNENNSSSSSRSVGRSSGSRREEGIERIWEEVHRLLTSAEGASRLPPPPAPRRAPPFRSFFNAVRRRWKLALEGQPPTSTADDIGGGSSSSSSGSGGSSALPPLPPSPLGLYLFGDVGCGKTYLMDLFYSCCKSIKRKKRIHFNAFMLDVHERMHEWKRKKGEHDGGDPIPPVAHQLASEALLLCFDEFQVTNVADAAILHRLFHHLFAYGVILLATSNRAPDDLYKGGLQRELFLPFIDMLKDRCSVKNLNSGIDYRMAGKQNGQIFFTGEEGLQKLEKRWQQLTKGKEVHPRTIELKGRQLEIAQCCGQIARLSFDQVCKQARGAADYIALANEFHTIVLENVPIMTLENKTEAKRFIVFVDALYENNVKLYCNAEATPERLFIADAENISPTAGGWENELLDFLHQNPDSVLMFTGKEEVFQFARAVSRLTEMQTEKYLLAPWGGREEKLKNKEH